MLNLIKRNIFSQGDVEILPTSGISVEYLITLKTEIRNSISFIDAGHSEHYNVKTEDIKCKVEGDAFSGTCITYENLNNLLSPRRQLTSTP